MMSAVDLLLVPSRIETFSLVGYEAVNCNTPVVVFPGTAPTYFEEQRLINVAEHYTQASFLEAVASSIRTKEVL
jgi:hypothetical protein